MLSESRPATQIHLASGTKTFQDYHTLSSEENQLVRKNHLRSNLKNRKKKPIKQKVRRLIYCFNIWSKILIRNKRRRKLKPKCNIQYVLAPVLNRWGSLSKRICLRGKVRKIAWSLRFKKVDMLLLSRYLIIQINILILKGSTRTVEITNLLAEFKTKELVAGEIASIIPEKAH